MTIIPSKCENRTTQMKKLHNCSPSDWESHVAHLLLQLSQPPYNHHHLKEEEEKDGDNEYYKRKEMKTKNGDGDGDGDETADASSSTSSSSTPMVDEIYGEEDDGYPKRRIKRFRLVHHIYKSTKPIAC